MKEEGVAEPLPGKVVLSRGVGVANALKGGRSCKIKKRGQFSEGLSEIHKCSESSIL